MTPEKKCDCDFGTMCVECGIQAPDIYTSRIATPHTHGEHGSHTEVYAKWSEKHHNPVQFLQFICLDDGVIYKEIEITREVK